MFQSEPVRTRRLLSALVATVMAVVTVPAPSFADVGQAGGSQRLIVKFREGAEVFRSRPEAIAQGAERTAARRNLAVIGLRSTWSGAQVLELRGSSLTPGEMESLLDEIRSDPNIEYVEPDRRMRADAVPNDPRYNEQWGLFDNRAGLRLPTAWDRSRGAGVVVAVIDTGVRPHADLRPNLLPGYDFVSDTQFSNDGDGRDADASDPGDWRRANECEDEPDAADSRWHGTHVAGIIAALTDNGQGVAGVASAARVLPVRALGRCGGFTSDIADAIAWAGGVKVAGAPLNPTPARVINLSLGGEGSCAATTQTAIDSVRARGSVVVVSAGNESGDAARYSPGNCKGVVVVTAVSRSGVRARYANTGSVVDLAAPGGDASASEPSAIVSTYNAGTTTPGVDSYAYFEGTSMAAPHVAGLAALMLSIHPSLSADGVESMLKSSVRPFPSACSGCGAGLADAPTAVASALAALPPPTLPSPPLPTPSPTPTPEVPPAASPRELQNDGLVTALGAEAGSSLSYTLSVPAGVDEVSFTIAGGVGNADLYVRLGAKPDETTFDCRSQNTQNADSCTLTWPRPGVYHVLLKATRGFSGVSLSARYTMASTQCPAGYDKASGSLTPGATAFYPDGDGYVDRAGSLHRAELAAPASTDFDLYLQRRDEAGQWVIVATANGIEGSESVEYDGAPGTYRWRVVSYLGGGKLNLCVRRP